MRRDAQKSARHRERSQTPAARPRSGLPQRPAPLDLDGSEPDPLSDRKRSAGGAILTRASRPFGEQGEHPDLLSPAGTRSENSPPRLAALAQEATTIANCVGEAKDKARYAVADADGSFAMGEGDSLWTIGLLGRLSDFILVFFKSVALFYFDERGHSPIGRFLRPDRPGEAFLPAPRVSFFIFLGVLLSAGGVYLTEDQYIQGPQLFNHHQADRPERVTNASDLPIHIAFRNVGCEIFERAEAVLQGVTGEVSPGRLTAILGRSGSGKTTLANMILGRSRTFCFRQSGTVFMNGRPRSLEVILDRVGFVPQEDIMYRDLTVRETLYFSAESRLPRFASPEYKERVVEDTLDLLGLRHLADNRIQNRKAGGLSGGEIKRVSIGMELVTHPSVLIMDEPTSGLDSAAAYHIMRTLRDIADRGVAVVAVLHQPTTRIYNLIDDLILLQAGKPVYVGARNQVFKYLESAGFRAPEFAPRNEASHADDLPSDASPLGLEDLRSSPPEYLVDILADVVQRDPLQSVLDNDTITSLTALWHRLGTPDVRWRDIEVKMANLRDQEQQLLRRLYPRESSAARNSLLEMSGFESCDDNYPSVFRFWCYIMYGMLHNTSYPVRPKPGVLYQTYLWFTTFVSISWRQGPFVEMFIVVTLASTVALTRSYNMTWNRRALGGFFTSISLSLCGMLGALFNDDIGPVRRAAGTGMVLGAYQFALILFTVFKGAIIANLYAVAYFTTLYLRRGTWCCAPFALLKYLEFAHMLLLLYMCAHGIGSVICVLLDHNLYSSYVLSVAVFIFVHTFAFFAPNKTQVHEDALIFGTFDTEPFIQFLCSLSYVRYFMEAFMLWEPHDDDAVGRNTALRYFNYRQQHRTMCYTCLFAIWAFNQALRFLMFARQNRNVFNALHDTPLFIIFVTKVAFSFVVSLLTMTVVHEAPRIRRILRSTVQEYHVLTRARSCSSEASSFGDLPARTASAAGPNSSSSSDTESDSESMAQSKRGLQPTRVQLQPHH